MALTKVDISLVDNATGFTIVTKIVTVAASKYVIDGVSQDTLTLTEGYTYKFDTSHATNATHHFKFSTTADGTYGSGVDYTTGVTYNGTSGNAGAYTQIVVAASAPTLYYWCHHHASMGGTASTPAAVIANKLLAYDGSGNLPAVDGSLLTGIVSATSSASDPTISTNPSGGVGTEWQNTTSGEVYICTDATAGANVWTNVGTGTGNVAPDPLPGNDSYALGGTVAGFSCGGIKHSPTNSASNRIDRYAFASSSNSTDHADVVEKHKGGGAGSQSTTHGYGFAGARGDGYSGPAPGFTDMIQKFAFASGNASDTGYNCILEGRRYSNACATTTYAYICGGDGVGGTPPYSNVDDAIERFSFSTEANTVDHGNLIGYVSSGMTASGVTHGFYAGGWTNTRPASTGVNANHIQYFAFASNTTATDAGDLTVARNGGTGWSGPDYGYAAGGWSTEYANTIDKYALVSGGNATDVGDLLDNAGTPSGAITGTTSNGGTSSTTHGYFTFGGGGVPIPTMIQRCAFASDGNATDVGEMTQEGGGGRTGGWCCWD